MEEYFDEICLLALCCMVLLFAPPDAFSIAGFLAALVLVCLNTAPWPRLNRALQLIFALVACLLPCFFAFLPVVAYTLMGDRARWPRALWVIPLAVALAHATPDEPVLIAQILLCAMAVVMAVRDMRLKTERAGMRRAYDSMREHALELDGADKTAISERGEEAPNDFFADLTDREFAVVQLVAEGMDNREIASRLYLSEGTVRNHISAVLAKKDLKNRTQIAVRYYRS